MKKILPVSLLAIWVACPALAENFPNDGYMLENKTYDNAATYENMGVYSDSVEANAYYDVCPGGSYCDETGVHPCPSGYSSAIGASVETECYKACTTANIQNSTNVSGRDYYNTDQDTCSAESCDKGYQVRWGLKATIGNEESESRFWIDGNGNAGSSVSWDNASNHGLTGNNVFGNTVAFYFAISGQGRCSTEGGTNNNGTYSNPTIKNSVSDDAGANCWCQLTGYQYYLEDEENDEESAWGSWFSKSSKWVFLNATTDSNDCSTNCASACASAIDNSQYRDVIIDTIPGAGSTCEPRRYYCFGGEYLPAGADELSECPAGSYCPCEGALYYDESKDQGKISCSTLANGAYPNSDSGAADETECYAMCTVENANIDHAKTVDGVIFYGEGAGYSCVATDCVNGYHVPSQPDWVYVNNLGNWYSSGGETIPSTYGISGNNTFAVDYGDHGVLTGHAKCSSKSFTISESSGDWNVYSDTLPDEYGENCWCKFDSYTPSGGTKQTLSGPWVFNTNGMWAGDEDENCDTNCARWCTETSRVDGEDRAHMLANFDFIDLELAACEPNTIAINWNHVDSATAGSRNESTATYGGDINTPYKAEVVPGKVFRGWKFIKPEEEVGS